MTVKPTRYRVIHETFYDYRHPIGGGHHLAHLSPRETAWQRCAAHQVTVIPAPAEQSTGIDYFGNPVLRFAHDAAHRTLTVRAESEVLVDSQLQDWDTVAAWEDAALDAGTILRTDDAALTEYRLASPHVQLIPAAVNYARRSFKPGRRLLDALRELTARIREDFAYDPHATTIATPVAEVAARRRGVCQDFAHFMLSGVRGLGLTARYMSGYILNAPAGPAAPATQGADSSHAWIAVHAGAEVWIGCDPTNGKLADLEFVTLGWGRDFGDVTPLRGVVLGGGTEPPKVAVQMVPL